MRKKKTVITGIGAILMAGAFFIAWQKSKKQRQKIEDMYYTSIDERDVAWG